jgi:hypothetical protein
MKCPACHREVPDNATRCPHAGCGHALATKVVHPVKRPPPPGPVRMAQPATPGKPVPAKPMPAKPPAAHTGPLNPPTGTRSTRGASAGMGWPRALAVAVMLVLFLGLAGGVSYVALVMKYAKLDSAKLSLLHDAADPARIVLKYQPLSEGEVGVRYLKSGQELEMLDHVPPDDVGGQRELELPWVDIQPGDRVNVDFRSEWWTASRALPVPEAARGDSKVADLGKQPARPKGRRPSRASEPTAKGKQPPDKQIAIDEPAKTPDIDATAAATDNSPDPVAMAAAIAKLGLYGARTAPNREQWLVEYGGSNESEQVVAAGLVWLARHQADDGHWGPDCLGAGPNSRCEKNHSCGGPGGQYEAALTGLAVLAFQAGGHYYFNGHQYSDHVTHGLTWLAKRQGPGGELVGSLSQVGTKIGDPVRYEMRYMYEHAIATFAVCEACALAKAAGEKPDPTYLDAATRAVRFIEAQQHADGGWRYTPEKAAASDCSVSGWVMLALKTAREAEIKVDETVMQHMVAFFENQADHLTGRTHYQTPNFVSDATTGVGMMVHEFVLRDPQVELVRLAADYLAGQAESEWGPGKAGASDFYTWYNCTLAMFQAGGDDWKRWNNIVRDHVMGLQITGNECVRGSWEPKSQWGAQGGRIYTTALGVLTLEVYYRFAREQAQAAASK